MEIIKIGLRNATARGRLYYYRDPQIERNILFVQNNIRRKRVYTVNVNNLIILSADLDHLLMNVECIYRRKAWIESAGLAIPNPMFEADIELIDLPSKNNYFELPVRITTDVNQNYAQIVFGNPEIDSDWVALSNHCFALISSQSVLSGFFVKLLGAELSSNPKIETKE